MNTKETAILDNIYKLVNVRNGAMVIPNVPEERLRIQILQLGGELSDLLQAHTCIDTLENFDVDKRKLGAIAKAGFPQISAEVFGDLVDDVLGDPIYFTLMKITDSSKLMFKRHPGCDGLLIVVDRETGLESQLGFSLLLKGIGKTCNRALLRSLLDSGILTKEERTRALKGMILQPKV